MEKPDATATSEAVRERAPEPDPVESILEEIRAGVRMREGGDVAGARAQLSSVWAEVEHGDAFARLFLAHSLADVQGDPDEELRWDVVALDISPAVTPERAAAQQIAGGREGLLPSLYLNLAHDYARLGRHEDARQHYSLALQHKGALGDDPYGDQLRRAYDDFRAEYPQLF